MDTNLTLTTWLFSTGGRGRLAFIEEKSPLASRDGRTAKFSALSASW